MYAAVIEPVATVNSVQAFGKNSVTLVPKMLRFSSLPRTTTPFSTTKRPRGVIMTSLFSFSLSEEREITRPMPVPRVSLYRCTSSWSLRGDADF